MAYFLIKTLITSVIIAAISELGKRFQLLAAILASLPLVSILAIIWLYVDERNVEQVSSLSWNIFWMVIPSLAFFVLFPTFLKLGMHFTWSMVLSCGLMAGIYWIYVLILGKFGISL